MQRPAMVMMPEGFMTVDRKIFFVENGCWCKESHAGYLKIIGKVEKEYGYIVSILMHSNKAVLTISTSL